MSSKSFDGARCYPLVLGASGDVLAARQLAKHLIARCALAASDPTLATVILTAACLHVEACASIEPGLPDVAACLRELIAAEGPCVAFAASPMQFVQYAAMELRALRAPARSAAINYLVLVVDLATAKELAIN